jgi:threonine/homoserine/homoserine lactone efflux protein
MDIALLPRGLVIGFSVAAPLGPIGLLCIQRTLDSGRAAGFVSGLGAATADAIYGSIAAFGLTFISTTLLAHSDWIQVGGGLFLCYLGLRYVTKAPPSKMKSVAPRMAGAGRYVSTLLLTLANPVTIVFFAAIFAGIGAAAPGSDYASSALLVAGVYLGSVAWWLVLSFSVHAFRERFTSSKMLWVNRVSGVVIMLFGLSTIGSVATRLI